MNLSDDEKKYVAKLTAEAPPPIHAAANAAEVRRLSQHRHVIEVARSIAKEAHDTQTDLPSLVRNGSAELMLARGNEARFLRPIGFAGFMAADLEPRVMIFENLLPERGIAMIYAWRGAGKTWVGLGLGIAAAAGGQFLRWQATRPYRVLHLCGEMPAIALRDRLKLIANGTDIADGYYTLLSADLHERGLPDLASLEGQAEVDRIIRESGAELIILDNLSTLILSGVENESESWLPVQNWLLSHRRQGRSTICIHHANKAKGQRGTSRREDVLDIVVNLRQPQDYEPADGARFEVHIEKARFLHGDAVQAFQAKMEVLDGKAIWKDSDIAEVRADEIAELRSEGLSIRQIANELGMSKSTVDRALKKVCPSVSPQGNGTVGQKRSEREQGRDNSGTQKANGHANQNLEARDGGT
jgi:hypothetical protein